MNIDDLDGYEEASSRLINNNDSGIYDFQIEFAEQLEKEYKEYLKTIQDTITLLKNSLSEEEKNMANEYNAGQSQPDPSKTIPQLYQYQLKFYNFFDKNAFTIVNGSAAFQSNMIRFMASQESTVTSKESTVASKEYTVTSNFYFSIPNSRKINLHTHYLFNDITKNKSFWIQLYLYDENYIRLDAYEAMYDPITNISYVDHNIRKYHELFPNSASGFSKEFLDLCSNSEELKKQNVFLCVKTHTEEYRYQEKIEIQKGKIFIRQYSGGYQKLISVSLQHIEEFFHRKEFNSSQEIGNYSVKIEEPKAKYFKLSLNLKSAVYFKEMCFTE